MGGTDLYRNLVIDGRKFCIKKLDAQTATYYGQECMDKILPSGFAQALGAKEGVAKNSFSKQEFLEMQKDFLKVCFEDLPAGRRPVIDEVGNYGIADIEYNAPMMHELLLNSMVHSLQGFFDASHLKMMATVISGLFPQDAPTSETSGSISP